MKLVKIPGHSDIIGNGIAEQKAKDIASEIKRFESGSKRSIST